MGRKINKNLFLIGIIVLIIALVLVIVLISKKEDKWEQEGNTITKGNQTITIGDYYDYDETKNGKIDNLTDVKWRVLGVEDGKLLIVSTSSVGEVTLGSKDDLKQSQNDYVNGINKLDEIASKYSKGKGAISARSITMEDINKITNYDCSNYGSESIGEYGNEVTYFWDSSPNPMYKGSNGITGNVSNTHNMFVWYDGKEWKTNERKDSTKENPIEIGKLKSNFYAYDITFYGEEEKNLLDENSNEYKMLFQDEKTDSNNYWVSYPFISTNSPFAGFGYLVVKNSAVNYTYIVYSMGVSRSSTFGVRAVVTID